MQIHEEAFTIHSTRTDETGHSIINGIQIFMQIEVPIIPVMWNRSDPHHFGFPDPGCKNSVKIIWETRIEMIKIIIFLKIEIILFFNAHKYKHNTKHIKSFFGAY